MSRPDPHSPSVAPAESTDAARFEDLQPAARGSRLAPLAVRGAGARDSRGFVIVTLAVAAALLIAVAAINAVVDPFGSVGTGVVGTVTWDDRAIKVDLVRDLKRAPRIIVFGSSRAMKIQPTYITSRTGESSFNAAVSSGAPVDTWVFANLIHDTFPDEKPRYLWLLDVEAFLDRRVDPGLLNQSALAAYLPGGLRSTTRVRQLPLLFSWNTLKMSYRALRMQLRPHARTDESGSQFDADGFRRLDFHDRKVTAGVTLAAELRKSVRAATKTYADDYTRLSPEAERYFEKTLAFMNSLGAEPVVVVSALHPVLLAAVEPIGWAARHRDVLAYLDSLHSRYRFQVLDYSRIGSFGGSPQAFYDGYHMTVANTRKLVDAVLAADGSALH